MNENEGISQIGIELYFLFLEKRLCRNSKYVRGSVMGLGLRLGLI